MELKVNKVTSTKSILTFDNYDLPFCQVRRNGLETVVGLYACVSPWRVPLSRLQPVDTEEAAENLGEHLTGDSIKHSPYEVIARALHSVPRSPCSFSLLQFVFVSYS